MAEALRARRCAGAWSRWKAVSYTHLGYTELTYEVRLSGDNTSFTHRLSACPGVESAVIVEFTGDYFE